MVIPSPYRSLVGPLLDYLDETDQEHNDGQSAVLVLPEFIPHRWWQAILHNQSAWLIGPRCCTAGGRSAFNG